MILILRRHSERVARFNQLWWDEIERGSQRDQISFPYAVAKAGVRVGYFPGSLHAWRPDFNRLFYKVNRDVVSIVQRKITWAEGARRSQALSSEYRQNAAAADRQWQANLTASHNAELARRQTAGAALLQWSAQQQMINAANRPVMTNCSRFGNSVNCTSY